MVAKLSLGVVLGVIGGVNYVSWDKILHKNPQTMEQEEATIQSNIEDLSQRKTVKEQELITSTDAQKDLTKETKQIATNTAVIDAKFQTISSQFAKLISLNKNIVDENIFLNVLATTRRQRQAVRINEDLDKIKQIKPNVDETSLQCLRDKFSQTPDEKTNKIMTCVSSGEQSENTDSHSPQEITIFENLLKCCQSQ